jgi:S-adenosylmethionine decarboxylase
MTNTNGYVWGYHASIDMTGCNKDKITNKDHIITFVKELVEAIDMKAYGEPECVYFAEHDPSKAGFTLTQLIETSNICAHFVDKTGEVYLDVFSCKPFDAEAAAGVAAKYFDPHYGELFFRERGVSLLDNVDTKVAN